MPDFAVVTAFKGKDDLSVVFKKMSASALAFGTVADRAMRKVQKSADKLKSKLKFWAGLGFSIGAGIVIKEFIDFDHAITVASSKFSDLDRNTDAGKKTLADLGAVARKVGADTQFSSKQAAEGMTALAAAGFNSQQAMALLPGMADLATIAQTDFATATNIAADSLGAFGLMTANTAKLTVNFTRLQDVMAKTVDSSTMEIADLFETIKFGAPAFTGAGQQMETFNAIAGRMSSSGIKGSNAGTALRSAITRLQKPTKDVTAGLAAYGLSMDDIISGGKLKDMIDIMKLMEQGGKKLTLVQKNAALVSIVGKHAFSGWAAVMNEGVKNSEELRDSLMKAGGSAKKTADIVRLSLKNQLDSLGSAAVELGFKFLEAFTGPGSNGIKKLEQTIKDLYPAAQKLGQFFASLLPYVPMLVKAFLAYAAVMKIVAVVQAISNLVMLASPAVWITLGILALVAAGIALYKNWDVVSVKLVAAFKWIRDAAITALLLPTNFIISVIVRLLMLAAKIPFIGGKIAGIANALSGVQASANNAIGAYNPFAPNTSQARNSSIKFDGKIDINNAPQGTTVKSSTRGAKEIPMNLVGENRGL